MHIEQTFTDAVREVISRRKKITIVTHHNPDGDAIGSILGLGTFMEKAGCPVTMITPNPYPYILDWMEGLERIVNCKADPEKAAAAVKEAEAIFFLDMNTLERLDALADTIRENSGETERFLIDHHLEPATYYDHMLTTPKASSTCFLIHKLIRALDMTELIDREIAQYIYIGMATDTGNFSYGNLTPETYTTVASLVASGADPVLTSTKAFGTFSENRLHLLGFMLSERMTVDRKYRIAYAYLTRQDLNKYHYRPGDTENFVNNLLSVDGVDMSAIFIEFENYVKISFRSRGEVDVNRFSRLYFNGGGHRNAAGGKSNVSREDTLEQLQKALRETFEK